MLIPSRRHTQHDLEQWARDEETDAVNARRMRLSEMAADATEEMRAFASGGRCYLGVSWGKDSVVVVHLAAKAQLAIPFVYVRVRDVANPDCDRVRDAFLRSFPVDYHEIETGGGGLATGRLEAGFSVAGERFGDRYISGVRGQESKARARRMGRYGASTWRTCAPIGYWRTDAVFAYLYLHQLPVHPAYAMTAGGLWTRDQIRVATVGGERGRGHGRAEWERRYYPELSR